jgi:CRISPR-associated protein Cmr6
MVRPLPRRHDELLEEPRANLSLRFDRGYDGYDRSWRHITAKKKEKIEEGKTAFVKQFARKFSDDANAYAEFVQRRNLALPHAHSVEATLSSPLLAGLGRWNPTGLGFTLDRFTGCPYVPGSSVKGLLREAAKLAARGEIEELRSDATFWAEQWQPMFGRDPGTIGEGPERGLLCVFDAYPTKWPKLEVDVLTPHQGDYYTGSASSPPADWNDPIPVHFLRLAAGEKLAFWFAPRRGSALSENVVTKIETLLVVALDWIGLGGKTSSGYGWFASPATTAKLSAPAPAAPGRATKPDSPPEKMSRTERVEWSPAVLTFNPGSGTLRADHGGEHAETRRREVIDALSAELRNRLKNAKRPVTATVTVEKEGNQRTIVEVREPPKGPPS